MGLNEQQMLWALCLASAQPAGLQEMFGTMTRSFHPGRAAQNGLTAALLAARNYTSALQSLEARYGWANVLSTAIASRGGGQYDQRGAGPHSSRVKDGRRLEKFIEHAVGSVGNPISDRDLETKFEGLADGVFARSRVHPLMDMCW